MAKPLSVASVIEKNRLDSDQAYLLFADIEVVDPDTGVVDEVIHIVRNQEALELNGTAYEAASFDVELKQESGSQGSLSLTVRDMTRAIQARMQEYGGGIGFNVTVSIVPVAATEAHDAFNGMTLSIETGPGSVQEQIIADYDAVTKIATLPDRWATNGITNSENQSVTGSGNWSNQVDITAGSYTDIEGRVYDTVDDADGAVTEACTSLWDGIANDSDPYIASRYIKKTVGDAHFCAFQIAFSIVGVTKSGHIVINTNTGEITSTHANVEASGVVDEGDAWRVWLVVSNNSSGNTRARTLFYPAWNATGAAGNVVATTGSKISGAVQFEKGQSTLGNYVKSTGSQIVLPDETSTYAIAENGKTGTVRGVTETTLTLAPNGYPSAPEIVEYFQVVGAEVANYTVTFTLGAENALFRTFPRRMQMKDFCQWRYKDADTCAYAGVMPTCDMTLQGPNGCAAHANTPNFGAYPGLNSNGLRYV